MHIHDFASADYSLVGRNHLAIWQHLDGINAHKYQVVFLSCPGSQHVGDPGLLYRHAPYVPSDPGLAAHRASATIDPHVNRTAGIYQLSDDAFGCHDRLSDPTLPGRCHWLCVDRLDRYAFLENQPPHDLDGRITRSAVCVTNGWFGTTVPSFADLHSVDRTSRKCPPLVRQP